MEIPSNSENDPEEPDVDANGSKMEVIEVTGAWKNCQPDQYEDVEEVPLDDLEPIPGQVIFSSVSSLHSTINCLSP